VNVVSTPQVQTQIYAQTTNPVETSGYIVYRCRILIQVAEPIVDLDDMTLQGGVEQSHIGGIARFVSADWATREEYGHIYCASRLYRPLGRLIHAARSQ